MCLSGFFRKAREFYRNDRRAFLLIALIAIVGIALRLSFINRTDISGDEVFFVTYAYKIANLLWQAPVVALALAAVTVLFGYLVVVKRSLWAAVAACAILLIAKYGFGIPYLVPRVGPVYILATTAVIYFTNLVPNIAGELVSTIALSGLAFVGLFIAGRWGKSISILAFALLMFSPYEIFMSTTSFVSPLGFFFMFSSIALFFEGLRDSRLLPAAGILAALGYATRLSTVASVPVFIALIFLKRKELLAKENRKNLAVFVAIAVSALIFMAPVYLNQVHAADSWYDNSDNVRWDLVEAHLSGFVAQAADPVLAPNQDHFFIVRAMGLFYSPLFILLLVLAVPYVAWKSWRERDLMLASLLFIGIGVFLAFFVNLAPHQRINRCLGYDFPFVMLVAFLLSQRKRGVVPGIGSGRLLSAARTALGAALVLVFLYSSLTVIAVHDFKGISEFVESIPEDSLVYCDNTCYQVSYYRGIYLYDLSIRKPFFDKIFKPDPETEALFRQKAESITGTMKDIPESDFALVRPEKLDSYRQLLEGFKRCKTIKNDQFDMVIVFARENCP